MVETKTKTRKVVKNAKSTYEIEKNHLNLVEIQRRANFKRLQPQAKFQHGEMLHKLDQTRRELRAEMQGSPDLDDPTGYTFKPTIDKTSNAIMQNINKDVLGRTYDWLDMKLKKNTDKAKDQEYKQEEDIKNATIKHTTLPKSSHATSKVRVFLETQQNNLNLTNTFREDGGVNNQHQAGVIQYTGFQGQPVKSKKRGVHTNLDPVASKKGPKVVRTVLHNVGSQNKSKLGEVINFYQAGNMPVDSSIKDPRSLKMKDFKNEVTNKLKDM
jgi:hypothetical protein